jgi:hypothetical protein
MSEDPLRINIMTQENDLVLIYFEDKPLSFARVEDISPDVKRGWYHVRLLILQLPVQMVTWILREAYINGEEFTMNGKKMRLEKVVPPEIQGTDKKLDGAEPKDSDKDAGPKTGGANVISLADMKKK